jgi:hypothetical protein
LLSRFKVTLIVSSPSSCCLDGTGQQRSQDSVNNSTDMEAVETLLRLAETYGGHANTIGQQSTGTVKGAHKDDSLTRAEADLKVFQDLSMITSPC